MKGACPVSPRSIRSRFVVTFGCSCCLVAATAAGQISGRVWYDSNQDGIQDLGEPGVAGVAVDVYDGLTCAGVSIGATTTDSSGAYTAAVASIGAYCLEFSGIPAGWTITLQNQGADESLDSDADPFSGQVPGIVLPQLQPIADMGVFAPGSIGGTVWCDADDDLVLDPGEGVAGVTVSLEDDPDCNAVPDSLIATQATIGDGSYLFTGVSAGPPAGSARCYVVTAGPDGLGACTAPLISASRDVAIDAGTPDDLDIDIGFTSRQQGAPIPTLDHLGFVILSLTLVALGSWMIRARSSGY
jgi:hypothetical protein